VGKDDCGVGQGGHVEDRADEIGEGEQDETGIGEYH